MKNTVRNAALGMGLLCAGAQGVQAANFEAGPFTGTLNTTATVGFGIRTADPDCGLIGDPSSGGCGSKANTGAWSPADNGDQNYKQGKPFTTYTKLTSELLVKMPSEDVSFMARGSFLHDFSADDTDRTQLSANARSQIVNNYELYDLWVSKGFYIDDRSARIRVGNQVINWGESLFLLGGINATNAIDVQKSLIPGTQIKEFVLPAPMVSLAGNVANGVNVEGYYQFTWNRSLYPPVGSYWSAADFYDKGYREPVVFDLNNLNAYGLDAAAMLRRQGVVGRISQSQISLLNQQLVAGTIPGFVAAPIALDKRPPDSGQFGLSAHYKPAGSVVDLGVYYLRYHDKSPVFNLVGDPNASALVDFQPQFRTDRDVYGISTNFPLGDWAIGGELSYRPRDAVALSGCFTPGGPFDANVNANPAPGGACPLWADKSKTELHITGLLQLAPSDYPWTLRALGGADTGFLSIEGVATHYDGINSNGMTQTVNGVQVVQLPQAGYINWLNNSGTLKGVGTSDSGGAVVDFNWTYDGTVIPGWQLTPGVTYFRALYGATPTFSANYIQGVQSLNFYVLLNQNPTVWQAGLNYTTYFGGPETSANPYRDRDFVGGFVSFNF